jgi:palmitoyltransferase ZDHHC9/14/18
MATPQSLPSHPTTTHSQRPPQLPLPSASASSAQRSADASDHRQPGSPTATTSPRARHSLIMGEPARSPTFTTFHTQMSPTSTTHAGGIQPSASFFRPSRPSQQVQFSRPSSASSSGPDQNLPPILAPDGDIFQLAPLTKDSDVSSAEEGPTSNEGRDSTAEGDEDLHRKVSSSGRAAAARQAFSSQNRVTKRSREPLLPIGGRGVQGSNTRPPVSRGIIEGNASVSAGPLSPSGATRRFRSSIERVFRRGLSFESTRRSSSTRPPTADESGQQTSERKVRDEERGIYPTVPPTKTFPASIATVSPSGTPLHSTFIPGPSDALSPPRSAVPIIDPNTGKPMRNYQSHPSRNKFFVNGRLLTGGDSPWAFVATIILVLGISGTWFGTTCVWWWHNESQALAIVGAYMCLVVISSMLTTVRGPKIHAQFEPRF